MKGFRYVNDLREQSKIKQLFKSLGIALVISGLGACGTDKTDTEYLQSAKAYLQSGEIDSAVIELKNAIQKNPSNPEARYLLADHYLSLQQGARAEKELKKAIEAGYPEDELVDELAWAYYYQVKFDDLLGSSIQLDSLSDEEKSEILFLRGLANFGLQRRSDAQADFEESAKTTSGSYGKLAEAYNLAILENVDDALATTLAVLDENPDLTEANILAAKLFFLQRNFEKAASHQEKAIEAEPNRLQLYVDMARYQSTADNLDEAEKNIDIVLKVVPSHLPSNLIKARLRFQAKDFEGAKIHAERALEVSEISKEARLLSGMAEFYLRNWEASRSRLKPVIPFTPEGHIARKMIAYAEFKLGYEQSADDILNSIGGGSKSDTSLLSEFGTQMYKRGDADEALKLYGKAAEINPDDSTIKTRLGFLKLQQNDLGGISDLESVIKLNENSLWARTGLVSYHLSKKNFSEAEKLARSLITKKPGQNDGYLLTASVYISQKQFEKAMRTLDEGLTNIPGDAKLMVEKAKVSAYMNNDEEAKTLLDQALKVAPHDKNALVSNYRLDKKHGNTDDAVSLIKKARESSDTDDTYTLLYAIILIDQGDRQGAYEELSEIAEDSPQFIRSQMAMGSIKAQTGDFKSAEKHFDTVIDLDGTFKEAYLGKIQSQVRTDQLNDALATVAEAQKSFPGDKQIELREIEILLQMDRANLARSKIGRFNVLHGHSDVLETIQGIHAAKAGDFKAALQFFKKANKISSTTRSIISIAQMHMKLGQKKAAVSVIKDWLKNHPKDMAAKMYFANLNLNSDHSAAIEQYKQLLKENGNNLIALNNLAWALGEQGSIQEALTYAEKAYKLRAVPPVIDTYAFLLFQSGEHEKALPLLKLAHEKELQDGSIAYHYALALSQAGKKNEAKEILLKITKEDFPELNKAKALLKQINN